MGADEVEVSELQAVWTLGSTCEPAPCKRFFYSHPEAGSCIVVNSEMTGGPSGLHLGPRARPRLRLLLLLLPAGGGRGLDPLGGRRPRAVRRRLRGWAPLPTAAHLTGRRRRLGETSPSRLALEEAAFANLERWASAVVLVDASVARSFAVVGWTRRLLQLSGRTLGPAFRRAGRLDRSGRRRCSPIMMPEVLRRASSSHAPGGAKGRGR